MALKERIEELNWKGVVALHKQLQGGGIGDYARRNKATEVTLILDKFPHDIVEAALDATVEAAPYALNVPQVETIDNVVALRQADPEIIAESSTPDNELRVQQLLGMPLTALRSELSLLIEQANKPAVEVVREVTVEVPVERIVEKVVEKIVRIDGTKPEAAQASTYIPTVTQKTVKEVFGIALKDANGKPMMVDVYNDPDAPAVDPHYIWDVQHLRIGINATRRQRNGWLAGPRGTGKTQFVEQLAARLGRSCFRVNFNGSTERTEILGGDIVKSGSVVYREGVILQGIRRPGALILLDEVGFARAEYLSALHALLEQNGCYVINETGESVAPAQGVVFFAADNSTGHGDRSGAYTGVKKVNSAFLDRFAFTDEFDYLHPAVEAQIVTAKTGINEHASLHLCEYLAKCRTSSSIGDIAEPPSLRQAIYWAESLVDGVEIRHSFKICVLAKADPDSAEPLQQLFNASINLTVLKQALAGKHDGPIASKDGSAPSEAPVTMEEDSPF